MNINMQCRRCLAPFVVPHQAAIKAAALGKLPVCPSCVVEDGTCPYCPGECDCRVVPVRKMVKTHGERDEHRMVRQFPQPDDGLQRV